MSARLLFLLALLAATPAGADGQNSPLPAPTLDESAAAAPARERAVLAGGCFWGVQAVFQHVQGVVATRAGYTGGSARTANYGDVSTGDTGHVEAVEITYDRRRITYGRLLQIFFSVALDPTEVNQQGPDVGFQYRSVLFPANDVQRRIAEEYLRQLGAAQVYPLPIATEISPLETFYPAEEWHQNYVALHPRAPYVVINDLPKLARLRGEFSAWFRPKR